MSEIYNQLRPVVAAFDTRISEQNERFGNLKEELNRFYSIEAETGNIFRFGEADGALRAVPDSAVTVGNQNILVNNVSANQQSANGLTFKKNSDGSVTISGTATATSNLWINTGVTKIPRGVYTLSGCPQGGSKSTYRLICNYRIGSTDSTWLADDGNGMSGELTSDIDYIRCAFVVFSGTTVDFTFYPQLELGTEKTEYATCSNQIVSANEEINIDGIKTIFSNETFGLTLFGYKWSGDILDAQGKIDAITGRVGDLEESAEDVNRLLTENVQHFDIDDYSLVCIHHDNFSRTMTGWEIGMNAGGTDTGNNYEWVTASSYDDGLRVDEGATFEANSSRTNDFSLRKITADHADDFVVETNAPTANNQVGFAYNVTDIRNMTYISARKQTNGYALLIQDITNNRFGTTKYSASVTNVLANVMRLCFHKQWLYVFLDDLFVASVFIGDVGNSLYLFSYKGVTVHFDFVNVFNITNHKEWNPNHILDTGVADVPLITTSANDGGYALQNVKTRWSDYADKFLLNSTDPLVHNGHRSERSVANLSGYTGNLRHLRISFDAYFPSTSVDAERNDIMMQMHDRDGTYRGFVPFILNFDNNKIKITLASTHAPKDGADDVLKWVEGAEIASISTDEWHRFELEIKERYGENQNPFAKISIDSKLVFESHKPNCFNDLLGSSPQYGIYKNLWGTGVTTFERYFDNFKIVY